MPHAERSLLPRRPSGAGLYQAPGYVQPAADWRFESAAVTTPQLAKARGYAQNWDEFKKAGIGLLLFGNVGTGKSYAAGCIANVLIDRLESVLFVGMSDVVNHMQGNFGTDRDHYMKSLMRPDLLILDDLGAERNTSFGKERVFDVVDKRLLTGKPISSPRIFRFPF